MALKLMHLLVTHKAASPGLARDTGGQCFIYKPKVTTAAQLMVQHTKLVACLTCTFHNKFAVDSGNMPESSKSSRSMARWEAQQTVWAHQQSTISRKMQRPVPELAMSTVRGTSVGSDTSL